MTVSTTSNKNSYSANGTLHSFAYGFKIFADADLAVIVRSAAGVEVTQTLNTHYVVTNAGNASGGNVLFKFNTGTSSDAHFSATDFRPANNSTVVILRELTKSQGTDYVENDPFPADSHEKALDRLTFITQEIQEELDRSIKLSKTNTITSTEFTTSAADRASKILSFNPSGELAVTQELGTFKGNSATTTNAAYILRDIVKGTTTAQLNNIYICIQASPSGTALTNTSYWTLIVDAVSAATSATTATTKAGEASTSATNAATSETNAAATLTTFQRQYHGAASSDPSANLDAGDLYFNTSSGIKVYNGSAWIDVKPTSSEQTNINTVAGSDSEIAALAASAVIADMALLGNSDVIADMALLGNSDVIADMALLAVSDVIADINTLATSDIVTDINLLATSDIVSDLNTLATSDIISDLNTLATSAIVADINLLGTSDVVADLAQLATSDFVSDLNTLATSTNVTNIATVASNVAGVNSFADRYRIASSNPSSSLDEGDLVFNTTLNKLLAYNGSAWQDTSPSAASQTNINIVAGEITSTEDLGSITASIDTSSGNNIDTVANAISNVNTVAGANSNITALNGSGVISNIASVAGIASNVTTVAGNIANVTSFAEKYRVVSSAPTSSLNEGDLYYNTNANSLNYYNGSAWVAVVAGAMTSLATDTSPQLGGALDVNGNSIISASNGHITIDPNGSGLIKLVGSVDTTNLTMDFGSIA